MKDVKAVIFDLDGTLIDSMWIWHQIDIDFLNDRGHAVPTDLQDAVTHLSFKETAVYFKNRFELEDSIDSLMECWNSMAHFHYSNTINLKNGALEFILHLKSRGIKIGLATSNSRPLLEATLKRNNIFHLFDSITITDEVKRGKDFPDVYLLAASKLGVSPKDCMVFEDIVAAARGAKLAGMYVIGIYDASSKAHEKTLKEICDEYIYDYTELLC